MIHKLLRVIITAVVMVVFYIAWTGAVVPANIAVMGAASLLIAGLMVSRRPLPGISPKRIAYGVAYLGYLFIAIVRSNLDVAARVLRRRIPINPGIVKVRTRLKSRVGRMILANSITLTPGTLSVEMQGDCLFVHWIDVQDCDEQGATEEIVAGFEKYLEVIFG